jgi:hypothetical protein
MPRMKQALARVPAAMCGPAQFAAAEVTVNVVGVERDAHAQPRSRCTS